MVRQLSKCLKRRTSVNHLFHAAMLMMTSSEEQVYEQLNEVIQWNQSSKAVISQVVHYISSSGPRIPM